MLIRSISGLRGLTQSHLTPEVSIAYARSLDEYLPKGVIMSGRDSRPSGELLVDTINEELSRLGRTIIDCGIVPTPTVQYMVHSTEAVGGYIVTASHNPGEWNGIKFLRSDSTFFHAEDCEELFRIADLNEYKNSSDNSGIVWQEKNALQKHIISCASLTCIDLNRIQRKKYKVVVDAVNGAGSIALPALLESLGCEVIELNCEPNGNFTRGTEPLPEHLEDLAKKVVQHEADVGFAVDPDADRLAVVDEKGIPLGEESTIILAADGYLRETRKQQHFVVNLSTSMAIDKLAQVHNCKVSRSAVGEINVVNKMNDINSEFGGEGNGGVILRESHLGRDSLVAATLILNRMSQSDIAISAVHGTLPSFEIIKDKISVKGIDFEEIIEKIIFQFKDAILEKIDGYKFSWNDKWIHIRKSNTEPIIRIYAEAQEQKYAADLVKKIKNII